MVQAGGHRRRHRLPRHGRHRDVRFRGSARRPTRAAVEAALGQAAWPWRAGAGAGDDRVGGRLLSLLASARRSRPRPLLRGVARGRCRRHRARRGGNLLRAARCAPAAARGRGARTRPRLHCRRGRRECQRRRGRRRAADDGAEHSCGRTEADEPSGALRRARRAGQGAGKVHPLPDPRRPHGGAAAADAGRVRAGRHSRIH
mmetsp:Transcript_12415/g.41177  ORF Transcript_12415/g.41177 Transcript_12415/m.41177 type:complete len:202 (+) Transcript_12415:540-1145(+)